MGDKYLRRKKKKILITLLFFDCRPVRIFILLGPAIANGRGKEPGNISSALAPFPFQLCWSLSLWSSSSVCLHCGSQMACDARLDFNTGDGLQYVSAKWFSTVAVRWGADAPAEETVASCLLSLMHISCHNVPLDSELQLRLNFSLFAFCSSLKK